MISATTVRRCTVLSCALFLTIAPFHTVDAAEPNPRHGGVDFEFRVLQVVGELPVQPGEAFTAVSTDMDRDGDLDLLINWHHRGPFELFENQDGVFHFVNPENADRSGLDENRGVPSLYASEKDQVARIQAQGGPGLYVWHDPDRAGFWRFYLWREADAVLPAVIAFGANQQVLEVTGLERSEITRPGPETLRLRIPPDSSRRLFGVHVKAITTQAILRLEQPDLPVFAGRYMTPVGADPLSLWKPDPHGLAWVHVTGTPEPELFVARGSSLGNLAPPFEPKHDRFYEWVGGRTLYSMAAKDSFPQTYSRGRQVAWVDVDNDGVNELYIGNRTTPNTLAVRDPSTGAYVNRAAGLGLDLHNGESYTWIDFDDDGYQDLVYLQHARIAALRNLQGAGFAPVDAPGLGLLLENPGSDSQELFDKLVFHVTDFDNDGLLDVLVSGVGLEHGIELFLRRGSRYRNVTTLAGLEPVRDADILLLLDADNDSFEDLLKVSGQTLELLHNEGGSTFTASPIDLGLFFGPFRAATVTDVDSDGMQDAVLVSTERYVARNVSDPSNRFLGVRFRPRRQEPIGALVSAHYTDGSVRTQRYGSANNPPFSQTLPPLHFGVASGTTIRYLSVLWPGDPVPTIRQVRPTELGTTIDI